MSYQQTQEIVEQLLEEVRTKYKEEAGVLSYIMQDAEALLKLKRIQSLGDIPNGNVIGSYTAAVWHETYWHIVSKIAARATQDHSSSGRGTQLEFFVTPNDSLNLRRAMEIRQQGDVYMYYPLRIYSEEVGDTNLFSCFNGDDYNFFKILANKFIGFYDDALHYLRIKGNNIWLVGSGDTGNYIYGDGVSYLRFPVGNGTKYFDFQTQDMGSIIMRLRPDPSKSTFYQTYIRHNGINIANDTFPFLIWTCSQATPGESYIQIGKKELYNSSEVPFDIKIYGSKGTSSARGADIYIEPGEEGSYEEQGRLIMCEQFGKIGIGLNDPAYKVDMIGDFNIRSGGEFKIAGVNIFSANMGSVAKTPSSTGRKGEMSYNSGYLYLCTDTDTWVRTAVETSWL